MKNLQSSSKMEDHQTIIKIVLCAPYARTFYATVSIGQKVSVISKAYPNIKKKDDLVFWYKGAQLFPNSTFKEVGLCNNSVIVVGIKTDDLSLNYYWIKLSNYPNMIKYLNKTKAYKNSLKDQFSNKYAEKKFLFIQRIKSVVNEFDFSSSTLESTSSKNDAPLTKPLPILWD